jgi:hypothetical protein
MSTRLSTVTRAEWCRKPAAGPARVRPRCGWAGTAGSGSAYWRAGRMSPSYTVR